MKALIPEPFYEFSSKGLRNPGGFKRHADHAVREIFSVVGSDCDIQVHVEPEVKSKGLFTLSITANVPGQPIVVKKTGKRVYTLLKQAKKMVIKIFRRAFSRKIKTKRQPFHAESSSALWEAS
jgi:hypothetical protein